MDDLGFYDPPAPQFCRRCGKLLTADNDAGGWCVACASEMAANQKQ